MSRVVVIGGGFGGIASALRARARGHQVTLVDRCPRLGGRAQVFEKDGFRHDAGPTVLTAPFLFEELFELFDKRIADYVNIVPLALWYRFQFSDGDTFDYGGDLEQTLAEISRIHPPDAAGYQALLEQSRRIYDVGFTALADAPFHRLSFMLKQIPQLLRLATYRSVWQMVARYVKHDKIRQAFSIQPLLVGGNPFDTTSIYSLIHFLERAHGVHFAMGGTGALVDALERLMSEQGIEIRLNTTIESIEVVAEEVTAVNTDSGERIELDHLVSNTDPVHLYSKLLPKSASKRSAQIKAKHSEQSMGLFVLYFGTSQQYPDVAHHTIWLGPRYRDLLDDIFHKKVLAEDFSIYLHRPTATDPSFAPPGCDSFYALVPVPNLTASIDWSTEAVRLRDRVVAALDATILPGLNESIRADFFMTPEDFETRYLSPAGAGFSIAPHFRQSAWFRFHNRGEGPRNLYLAGAGSHPGAGLPGVLSSAKIVERLLPAPTAQRTGDSSRSVLRKYGRTFYFASQLLGSRHAERAAVLYGFCRHVDNLADEACDPQAAMAALEAVRQALISGRADDPWTTAMLSLKAATGMPLAPALALLDGVQSDLSPVRLADEASLLRYAYQVAGTVGVMMCAVLDVQDPRATPFAIDLGIAMQLTNIARDLGEDARIGRRYLPASWIGDVSAAEIAAPGPTLQHELRVATQRLLSLADRYYASGEAGLAFIPLRARLAILAAARMYRAIGGQISAVDCRTWDRRAVVGSVGKAAYTAQALLVFAFSPRLHRRNAVHDATLQEALTTLAASNG